MSQKQILHSAVIETPRGSRNKYTYNEKTGRLELRKVLPASMAFPFDFGFLEGTKGEDGDPLDVLILMDEPAFPGCMLQVRIIGVIEAEERENERTQRNDRFIAVAEDSYAYSDWDDLSHVSPKLLDEIEKFFVAYQHLGGKEYRVLRRSGVEEARRLIDQQQHREEAALEPENR